MTRIHPEIRRQCPIYRGYPRVPWGDDLSDRECPCARLLDRWNTADPPTLICFAVASASVRQVAETWLSDLVTAVTPKTIFVAPLDPWPALKREFPAIHDDLQVLGQHISESDMFARWPFPWKQRWLVLVLRQWAQEKPNQSLANLLESTPEWDHIVWFIRKVWRGSPTLLHDVAAELARYGLPVSPATIGFTLASAIGVDNVSTVSEEAERLLLCSKQNGQPLPARGLLVTTLIFAAPDMESVLERPEAELESQPWIVQSNPEIMISGDLEHATSDLLRTTQKVAGRHRQFAQGIAQHPFSDIHRIRSTQVGAWAPQLPSGIDPFDYVADARQTLKPLLATFQDLKGKPLRLRAKIAPVLTQVQNRVGMRRERAGLPRTPPKGWREKVFDWVVHELEA